jgi:2-keto-4-pentenoate hydratase
VKTTTPDDIQSAASRLLEAARTGRPCAPVRDLLGAGDVRRGYAVQELLTAARVGAGARIVGRKIGLTSAAVQTQLGVDQPDFGVLFDDMQYASGDPVPHDRLLQPQVEAEVAFILGEDLDGDDFGIERVRAAVGYATAALEIVDSRIAGWDISYADTVADNASSGLFVLGHERVSLDEFDPQLTEMSMTVDGDEVSVGRGSACLGDPLLAVAWLAGKAAEFGDPLRAGQIILSGALGPMVPVEPGVVVRATMSGLGEVSASFTPIEGQQA